MARGWPAFWSGLLSIPFFAGGGLLYLQQLQSLQLAGIPNSLLQDPQLRLLGIPLLVFGGFILLIGLYVQVISPPEPDLHESEEIVDTRHPSQRVASLKIVISVPFMAVATYLFLFTLFPYVYPTVAFLIGLYFFSTGLKTYWANTLTTYYVTSDRIISEYRFLSLRKKELPLSKLRAVEERKTILETLVGLGNIRVASGGGGGSVVLVIRNIGDATSFAHEVRNLTK